MTVFSYVLKGIFILIFLLVLYFGTVAYLPCVSYPRAYLQALEISKKTQVFQSKHNRLPNLSSKTDLAELQLRTDYGTELTEEDGSYVIHISPEGYGFDFPWVVYSSLSDSISCGHR